MRANWRKYKNHVIELCGAMTIILFSYVKFGLCIDMFFYGGLLSLLFFISIVDIRTCNIPNRYIIIGCVWAMSFNMLDKGIDIIDGIYGGLVGGASILAISLISVLLFQKPGMGGGDVKLMAMAGLFIGWELTLLSIVLAIYIAGIIFIILLLANKISKDDYLPFGPYLAIGVVLSLFLGDSIIDWYTGMLLP